MIEITCPRCAHSFNTDELQTFTENEYVVEDNCPECGEYIVFLYEDEK